MQLGTRIVPDVEKIGTITRRNSAFEITREDYKSERAVYIMPGKELVSGDMLEENDFRCFTRGNESSSENALKLSLATFFVPFQSE